MRAVVIDGPDICQLSDVPSPVPAPGWALVRVRACGICATDVEVLHGRIAAEYPLVPGHEWSGVVEAVGNDRDAAWIGKRVAGENEVSCLTCAYCRTGHPRQCHAYQQIGFGFYGGGYAQYLSAPVYGLHELPVHVSFAQGALLEPLAVAFGVVDRARVRLGDMVTILGDGSIGLHCLLVAKAAGARRIVLSGGQSARLDVARKLGAMHVVDYQHQSVADVVAQVHGQSDIVIEATGSVQGANQALDLVKTEGTVILAGYTPGHSTTLAQDMVQNANLTVVGANNNPGWMARALACVADGLITSEGIISHRYSLQDYAQAIAQCETREGDLVKSLFVW